MILKLIRFFRGYVVFRIIGRFPERFINLSIRQGFYLFDARSDSTGYYASMLITDFKNIRHIARKTGVRLRICEKHGVPVLLKKHRLRIGLVAGFAFFLIFSQLIQSFVWTVQINGIETVSESRVLKVLAENGLQSGVLKSTLDLPETESTMMSEIDEIGWMSLNIIGTKAEVEIKEKEKKPDIVKDNEPCNVKASCDGVIISVDAKQGSSVVLPRSAVVEGQLLVSSIMEDKLGETYFVRADAKVMAHTRKEKIFSACREGSYTKPAYESIRKNLRFFWLDIPVTFASAPDKCTHRVVSERVFINNTSLELGVDTEQCVRYTDTPYSLNDKAAYIRLHDDEAVYRFFNLYKCTEVNCDTEFKREDDKFILKTEYDCIEDIAYTEKLIVNQ